MTFLCLSRVLDPKARAKTVEGQPTSTLTLKNQSSVSMQPASNMPQQLTFCPPCGFPMMPVTQFQQQTYISFPPNSPTQTQPTQPQLPSSLQQHRGQTFVDARVV